MSHEACSIRPMRSDDLPLIGEWIAVDAEHEHYALKYATDKQYLNNLLAGISQGLNGQAVNIGGSDLVAITGWICESDTMAVGFAIFTARLPESHCLELWMMSVDPTKRYLRIGKQMIDALFKRTEIETIPVLARCNPASHAMVNMLSHRKFEMLCTGPEGTRFMGRGFFPTQKAFYRRA